MFDHLQMDFARATIGFELESLWMSPNPDLLIMEMIHAVSLMLIAYWQNFSRSNTCWAMKICSRQG